VPDAKLKIAHLFGHGTHLEFIEFGAAGGATGEPRANDSGTGHVCFKVADLDASVERIRAGGGKLTGRITEGAVAGIRGLYLRDPYGVLIELLELK
jgi:catechol 2,3-dioxygenase-like lactoylglutathione lyase family enzyme